ncbi:hypothetical protein GCM10020331_102940 [Ectobacillus funiculus]
MDNIRYGRLDATDEEVIKAAKAVQAHTFISRMKDGYQTEVNERGTRLSSGQRQLISFARVLLANPRVLILDEATSSIDTETELALQKGLENLLFRQNILYYCAPALYYPEGYQKSYLLRRAEF